MKITSQLRAITWSSFGLRTELHLKGNNLHLCPLPLVPRLPLQNINVFLETFLSNQNLKSLFYRAKCIYVTYIKMYFNYL